MKILEGLLTINGVDIYKEYSAFLAEDNASSHTNYDALLEDSAFKPYTAVSFQEENGERLPDALPVSHYEARDVTLQFGILTETTDEWYRKYIAFRAFLKSGWLVFFLPELGTTYRMYYKGKVTPKMVTPFKTNGGVFGKLKLKFRESNPCQDIDPLNND